MLAALLNTALAFGVLAVVFGLLERAYPARPEQPLLRPHLRTDLCYFLGQYLLWPGLFLHALQALDGATGRAAALAPLRAQVAALPFPAQVALALLLSDLLVYWGHRLQHHSALLWRFHAVHHSAEHLDWLAAHREHPLDGLYTQTLVNLPPILLGFPLEAIAGLIAFRGMWAIFIHSNVRLPLGPLRVLVGAPELHHWHHSRDRFEGNYANLSPLMDLLFGTYRCPDAEPREIGLHEPFPTGYLGQLLHPLRLRRGGPAFTAPVVEEEGPRCDRPRGRPRTPP